MSRIFFGIEAEFISLPVTVKQATNNQLFSNNKFFVFSSFVLSVKKLNISFEISFKTLRKSLKD